MDKPNSETFESLNNTREKSKPSKSKSKKIRPKSVSKSIYLTFDPNGITKPDKRRSNPSIIEKIIYRTFRKPKSQKKKNPLPSSKKRISKQSEIPSLKPGLNLSSTIKKKKSKEKCQTSDQISSFFKPEKYPKKKPDQIIGAKKSNKKTDKKFQILEYMKKKKSERVKQEFQEKLKKNAERYVKAQNMKKIEDFISKSFKKSDPSLSSIEDSFEVNKSGPVYDINRNISFIYEETSQDSIYKGDSVLEKSIKKKIDTDLKFVTTEDDRKSTDLMYKKKDFSENYQSPESTPNKFKFPNFLEIELQSEIEIKPLQAFKINQKGFTLSNECFLSINSVPVQINEASSQTGFKELTMSNYDTQKISPVPSSSFLESHSWNKSLMFLLDQLHLYEISDLTENFPAVNSEILKKIGNKYSKVKSFLQKSLEGQSEIINNLSIDHQTSFTRSVHLKKIEIQKLLTDIFEESLDPDADAAHGITHSQSLSHLHEAASTKIKNPGLVVSFGFESGKENNVISISDDSVRNIMTSTEIKDYIEKVFSVITWDAIENELKKPLIVNPLTELDRIQDSQIGTFVEKKFLNYPECFYVKDVLAEIGETLEDYQKIHKKMILDNLNVFFQQFRPFGYKGLPLPWVRNSRYLVKCYDRNDIKQKILSDFDLCNCFKIGSIVEIDLMVVKPSDEQLIKVKEAEIDKILNYEAILDESEWVDYEFEESQVKIDVADMLLEYISLELIKILE